jgi:integrase
VAYTEKRNGRWLGVYRDAADRKRSKTFDRKRDAEQWAERQEQLIRSGQWSDPHAGKITFGQWAQQWAAAQNVSPKTHDTTAERLRRLILPTWRDVRLDRITLTQVRSWVATMTTRRGLLAGETRRRDAGRLFLRILDAAVDEGRLSRNPARTPSGKASYLPRATKRKPHRYLTEEQLVRVADAINPVLRPMVLLSGFCGLRFGETCALTIAHVDTLNGRLTVEQAYTRLDDGTSLLGSTKTHAARVVIVPKFLRPMLREQVTGKKPADLLFAGINGQPLDRSHVTKEFNRAVLAAGSAVSTLQDALGVPEAERDGVVGTSTQAALRAFQQQHGLPTDGVVTSGTWAALAEATGGRGRPWTWRLKRLSSVRLGRGCEDFSRLTWHDLRHTAASLAVASGGDVKAVQRMLGHAAASMTLDTYAGLSPVSMENLAERLDERARVSLAHYSPTTDTADVIALVR